MNRSYKWLVIVSALALLAWATMAIPVLGAEVKGTIQRLSPAFDQVVVVDAEGKEWTFQLDDGTKVLLNDKEGQRADLRRGDAITVSHAEEESFFLATEIRCARK